MSRSAQAGEPIKDVGLVELVPDVYGKGRRLSLDEWRLAFAYTVKGGKGRRYILLKRQDLRHCVQVGRMAIQPTDYNSGELAR